MNNTEIAIENDGSMWVKLEDFKKVEANYDALQSPMPCGHLARYAVNEEDGTQYCVMCLCETVTGTTDTKIQAKIAEIINHE